MKKLVLASLTIFVGTAVFANEPLTAEQKKAVAIDICQLSVQSWATHVVASELGIITFDNDMVTARDNAAYLRILDAQIANQDLSKKFCEAIVDAALTK